MRRVRVVLALFAAPLVVASAQSPRFDAWKLSYAIPEGWRMTAQQGRVHSLGPTTNDAAIYVAPGPYQTFDEVAAELPKAFTALGLQGMPNGQPQGGTVGGMQSMSLTYVGRDGAGTPLEAKVIAVLTPHGTGLVALGVTRMGLMARLAPAMDQAMNGIATSGAPVPDAQAIAALRGKWMYFSGSTSGGSRITGSSNRSYEENVEFDGLGRYAWSSSASVSVTTPETGGVGGGSSAGGANAGNDQGTYTVIAGTLVTQGRAGKRIVDVQILTDRIIADGRTYFRNGGSPESTSDLRVGADSPDLVGRWGLVQLVRAGEDRTNPATGTRYYTFDGDGSFRITRCDSVLETGTWSQDTTARPRIFDHIPNVNGRPGQYIPGIFAIEGDTLRISILPPSPERRRPTQFRSSAEDRSWLLVYVRAARRPP
jgi:uncharacterized protein (TIGR03067 family)